MKNFKGRKTVVNQDLQMVFNVGTKQEVLERKIYLIKIISTGIRVP